MKNEREKWGGNPPHKKILTFTLGENFKKINFLKGNKNVWDQNNL